MIRQSQNSEVTILQISPVKKQNNSSPKRVKLLLDPFPYSAKDFSFMEVPTLELETTFFQDPFAVIDSLYARQYHKTGIVKLIVPADYVVSDFKVFQHLKDSLKDKRIETRTQIINDLQSGQPFMDRNKNYTVESYTTEALKFENYYKSQGKKTVPNELRQNEIEFWSIVDHPEQFEEVEVDYAADLLVAKYATAFEEAHAANLNSLNKQKNSVFQILTEKQEMSGISVPWLYMGMKFANFCWHCEDLYLNSMNYMHAGAPKTWYAIPPHHAERFQKYFRHKYAEEIERNPKLLYDIVCQISPVELVKNGITVYRTDQKPGELIFTMGSTFHAGFSHGLNCTEAVNIAPVQWLDEYEKAVEEYRKNGNHKKVSFPLEWILIKIANGRDSVNFTKQAWLKIAQKFELIIKSEISFRCQIQKTFDGLKIFEFTHKQEKYDRNVCKICNDYMYLSHLFCNNCLKKGCTHHISICACLEPKMQLYERYSNSDLNKLHAAMLAKTK